MQLTRRSTPVTFSAFELYEWHTTQQGTGTKPGDTINLDYSLIRTFAFAKGPTASAGRPRGVRAAPDDGKDGTSQSARSNRASDTPSMRSGFVTNLVLPNHRFNAGIKFFEEFGNRAAYQGYSLQVSGAVSF